MEERGREGFMKRIREHNGTVNNELQNEIYNSEFEYNPNGKNILIGGAWPYANNSLHLGHLAGLISGDVLARYHRLKGDNVIYVSGTDCHGTPITERAKKENVSPSDIAEYYHREFLKTFNDMDFSYDLYTKTKSEDHKKRVKEMFGKIYNNGYIYEKEDLQPYCNHCKKFVSDREIQFICPSCGTTAKGDQCECGYIPEEKDLEGAICQDCGGSICLVENKNLYLALSKLQPQIEEYVRQNEGNWRITTRNETAKYLSEGLRDRAVTRDLNWGVDIPVQGFEDKKMYVWIEAVLGYITATQSFCEKHGINWEDFWKENGNQQMYMAHGKDNITFHTIILPGLLMAMDEKFHLPDKMVSTQYLNINAEKISKSKGNGITVLQMIRDYNADSLRYFLISNGPETKDSNFSMEEYINTSNAEVTNKFGNFVNRTLGFKGLETVPNGKMDSQIQQEIEQTYETVGEATERLELRRAVREIVRLIELANKFYDEQKPWIQKKENPNEFNNTIYTCTNIVGNLSNLLEPIMPQACQTLREYLGIEKASWQPIEIEQGRQLLNIKPLFNRFKIPEESSKLEK